MEHVHIYTVGVAYDSVFIMVLCYVYLLVDGAIITVPPVSVTVPPLTTATFTCKGTGDILNWLVESDVLTDSFAQQRQISVTTTTVNDTNFSSVLTVNAIPINDGLGIGCEVITFSPFNRVISSSALTIRGISPVEALQYSFTTNTSLLITWSPPVYYSNDVPIGSPLSYQVLVTDDEDDGDIILDTNTPNTNIEVANTTECDTFNISITAIVAQYTSITNTVSNNGSNGYAVNITINKDNFIRPNVTIEVNMN
uniref:Fibronectin type-III domain-containing protein n=1 Tax=Amphimedon queenslandica TaxID=400682 RepID=A0A1X7T4E5_AMPQE